MLHYPDMLAPIQKTVKQRNQAFGESSEDEMLKGQGDLTPKNESLHILQKMRTFDASNASKPVFCVIRQYMEILLDMMAFVKAVRTVD